MDVSILFWDDDIPIKRLVLTALMLYPKGLFLCEERPVLYNFDEVIDRRNTGSVKWHYSDDTIPLWVADMDFKAAAPILQSIEQVTQHGILGYTKPTEAL